jgi:hypothetical protein
MNGILRVLAVAAVLSAMLGCDRAPRVRTFATVAGDYVVVERNGQPLPHTLPWEVEGRACTSTLIRMVMTLRDDGTWLEDVDSRVKCPGEPSRPEPMERGDPAPYTLRGPRGDTLDLLPPAIGISDYYLAGVLDGDELHLVMIDRPRADTIRMRYVRQPRRD